MEQALDALTWAFLSQIWKIIIGVFTKTKIKYIKQINHLVLKNKFVSYINLSLNFIVFGIKAKKGKDPMVFR